MHLYLVSIEEPRLRPGRRVLQVIRARRRRRPPRQRRRQQAQPRALQCVLRGECSVAQQRRRCGVASRARRNPRPRTQASAATSSAAVVVAVVAAAAAVSVVAVVAASKSVATAKMPSYLHDNNNIAFYHHN